MKKSHTEKSKILSDDENSTQRQKSDPPSKFSTQISCMAPWVIEREKLKLKPQIYMQKYVLSRQCSAATVASNKNC